MSGAGDEIFDHVSEEKQTMLKRKRKRRREERNRAEQNRQIRAKQIELHHVMQFKGGALVHVHVATTFSLNKGKPTNRTKKTAFKGINNAPLLHKCANHEEAEKKAKTAPPLCFAGPPLSCVSPVVSLPLHVSL